MTSASSNRLSPRRGFLCALLCLTLLVGVPRRVDAAEGDPEIRNLSTVELRERREDVGIGGPIALLSVGGALFLTSLPFFFAAIACETSSPYCGADGLLVVSGAINLGGAGMAIGGGVWLGSRLGERKAYDRELRRRDAEEEALVPRVTYGALPVPGGLGFGLGGAF